MRARRDFDANVVHVAVETTADPLLTLGPLGQEYDRGYGRVRHGTAGYGRVRQGHTHAMPSGPAPHIIPQKHPRPRTRSTLCRRFWCTVCLWAFCTAVEATPTTRRLVAPCLEARAFSAQQGRCRKVAPPGGNRAGKATTGLHAWRRQADRQLLG